MNAVGSLNLSSHDEGVRAIANFPSALDWLAIAFPVPLDDPSLFASPDPSSAHVQLQSTAFPTPPAANAISKKQAASALVRHILPFASREVLAPCFRIAGRFVLGRTLGNLYVPVELGLPQLAAEQCEDARFVLDLHNGSLVEVRQYATTRALLCIAYTAYRAEFLSLPPLQAARVEIAYQRDPGAGSVEGRFQPLYEGRPRPELSQDSWHFFCINYSSIFPTGPMAATVTSEPGPAAPTFRRESITVTLNDPYAMTFSGAPAESLRISGNQARRIAPKRLLPRPST